VNLRDILRSGETGIYEFRSMNESDTTTTDAGDLVKPEFADTVWRLVKEYASVLADCQPLRTDNGAPLGWPVVSAFTASGSAQTEGDQLADGSPGATTPLVAYPSLIQFGQAPTYGARIPVSRQLVADGNVDVEQQIAAAAAEGIGRQVASVVSTALYGAAVTGNEVTLTSVTNANLALLLAKLDPAFVASAKVYMNPADWSLLVKDDAVKAKHFPLPIVVTNTATPFVSSTVSGPVVADLSRSLILRQVASLAVHVSQEIYADSLQYGVIVYGRYDVKPTGQTTSLVFSH
jgi:HK97 family phage major capsid protein